MENRLCYLQHVDFETPAGILDWAATHKLNVSGSHLYRGDQLPDVKDFDHLIVMGGPMGANDDHLYAWMRLEKKLIEASIKAGKKVIGICLGSQFLADVLGAPVYKNSQKEIGWFPIEWTKNARSSPLFQHMPQQQLVFHWHGDTHDLPSGARHLASSAVCQNQAYQFGENVLGFQFHLEVKPENIQFMMQQFIDELIEAPYIQSAKEIEAHTRLCPDMNKAFFATLDAFLLGGKKTAAF